MSSKTIWTAWFQGADHAPPVVNLCLKTWQQLNPRHSLKILDAHEARKLLAGTRVNIDGIPPQALSDIVRLRLLSTKGGIWTDPSVLCVRPIPEWLEQSEPAGFFAFSRPAPDRLLSSWFLAAPSGLDLTLRWWEIVEEYWSRPRYLLAPPTDPNCIPPDPVWEVSPDGGGLKPTYPYFWFHYLFAFLMRANPGHAETWTRAFTLPAAPAHELQYLLLQPGEVDRQLSIITASRSPVHKLDWRMTHRQKEIERIAEMAISNSVD